MKTVFTAIFPFICSLLGYLLSYKYQESNDFWDSFFSWHKKIKSEISFAQNPLSEIFDKTDKSDKFLQVATEFFETKKITSKLNFLSQNEKDFLNKYLYSLGTTDKDSQLNFLNSVEADINKFRSDAETKRKKYRPLFIKLGFLVGLIIFILII